MIDPRLNGSARRRFEDLSFHHFIGSMGPINDIDLETRLTVSRGIERLHLSTKRLTALVCIVGWALGFAGCRQQSPKPTSVSTTSVESVKSPATAADSGPSAEPVRPLSTANQDTGRFPIPPNEPVDLTQPIVDENGVTFLPAQLNKNNSLLVLAFEPDIRAEFIIMTVRTILDADQLALAKQMALSYDDQFQDLERERAAILATAGSAGNIDRQVVQVQMKLATLIRQIRTRINSEIMTVDQRKENHRLYLEKMEEKASRESAKNRPAQ